MGFWDVVGKAANSLMNEVKDAAERNQAYKSEMLSKSDNELAGIIKREHRNSPLKASAAMQELKSRGYGEESIKELVRNA